MKINYRPEIDGLRAIAVCAVIFYHADFPFFNGGYIGVDIFFVISGYLITSIILKELILTGTFSFKSFYERRIRRIIPVLLLVFIISLPIAWLYLLPTDLIDFSRSVFASTGFFSNIYFLWSGLQYGAGNSLNTPLLHTWSLSIEEQYYIFFPILSLFIYKYLKKYFVYFLFLGFFFSLGFAHYLNSNFPNHVFYLLPTRGWELLTGSILAYFEIKQKRGSKNLILNSIFTTIGIFAIIFSILFFNEKTSGLSLYMLIPITGVSLIIWFSDINEPITKLLSKKFIVFIGLISYSLYLWHYPIFVFDRITESAFSYYELILLVVLLSIFSFYFVERPFRNKKIKFKKILIFISLTTVTICIVNFKIIISNGYEERFFITKEYKLDSIDYRKENENFQINYNYDDYDKRKNVLIIGNSHAEDILDIMSKTNFTNKIYFNLASPLNRTGDEIFQIWDLYKFLKRNIQLFDHFNKQYYKSDLIIIATRFNNVEEDLSFFDELIKLLKKDKKKIIIFDHALEQTLLTPYQFNRLDYYVYLNNKLPNKLELIEIEKKLYDDLSNKSFVNNKIKIIAQKNDVVLIERKKIFCDIVRETCPAITKDGYKIYWDYGHITEEGAKYFAEKFNNDINFKNHLNSLLNLNLE